MKKALISALIINAMLIASSAEAQQKQLPQSMTAKTIIQRIYAKPTMENLQKAMLRASALDLTNPAVQTDYILFNECKIYIENYQNDFKLEKIRKAAQQIIEKERLSWPDAFSFIVPMQLDKYDFTSSTFMLLERYQLKNVNSFNILSEGRQQVCLMGKQPSELPTNASVRVDQPVTIAGLPLSKEQGQDLLDKMLKKKNLSRDIYARFNITVSYMPPLEPEPSMMRENYYFDGSLTSVEFFEDEELTKPIWVFVRG